MYKYSNTVFVTWNWSCNVDFKIIDFSNGIKISGMSKHEVIRIGRQRGIFLELWENVTYIDKSNVPISCKCPCLKNTIDQIR